MRDRVHEAVCKAAGWPPYCDRCGAMTVRTPHAGSICSIEQCRKEQQEEFEKLLSPLSSLNLESE